MARPEFTPGPWRAEGSFAIDSDGNLVARVEPIRPGYVSPDPATVANARLIAAAPDLYAALKVFLEARATGSANHLKLAETAARSAMRKADGDAA